MYSYDLLVTTDNICEIVGALVMVVFVVPGNRTLSVYISSQNAPRTQNVAF